MMNIKIYLKLIKENSKFTKDKLQSKCLQIWG